MIIGLNDETRAASPSSRTRRSPGARAGCGAPTPAARRCHVSRPPRRPGIGASPPPGRSPRRTWRPTRNASVRSLRRRSLPRRLSRLRCKPPKRPPPRRRAAGGAVAESPPRQRQRPQPPSKRPPSHNQKSPQERRRAAGDAVPDQRQRARTRCPPRNRKRRARRSPPGADASGGRRGANQPRRSPRRRPGKAALQRASTSGRGREQPRQLPSIVGHSPVSVRICGPPSVHRMVSSHLVPATDGFQANG